MNQFPGPPAAIHSASGELAPASTLQASAPPPTAEQAFFHIDFRRSLHQHWRLARNVALAFAVLAIAYVLYQVFWLRSWPSYVAQSIVYIQPTPAKVLPSEGGPQRWPYDTNTYESYIQQQMMNVSREDVLIAAVHKIDGFQGAGESDQSAAQRLVRALDVERIGDAYQFTISARAGSPDLAAQIANAATSAYIESASRDERSGDDQRLSMLKEEKGRITAALTADRAEQDALNKQLGVASVSTTVPDHYDEDITQTRSELIKARTDHDAAEAKFAALDAGHGPTSSQIDAQADEMIATDAGLVSMKTSLNARRAALLSQMANLTPVNPQYKQDEAELAKINSTLEAMMKDLRAKAAERIQLQLRSDLQRTAGVESDLNGQLRQLVGAASSATPKLQRSSDLAADITRLQARFATVDEQIQNITLEDSAPPAAYQVTQATPPLGRGKSGVFRNAVLIAFAGLFFALMAAVVAQKLDTRIYIASDIERVLGFAPLAQLPDFQQVSGDVADEYLLRLTSAIEHARKQGEIRNCIFTGAGPEAGVSTLVSRVRQMMEAMGCPTVLVDATGAQPPESAPLPPRAENQQSLVPVERISRPSALLQQMTLETAAEKETLVLTDTAPITISAETDYLARFVDCAIVVVESGVTTRAQLRQSAAVLQRLNVRAVGFVLNRISLNKADRPFQQSVEAIERHLQAQASHHSPRAQRKTSAPIDVPQGRESLAVDAYMATRFQPEVAAAAAAVARFSPTHAPVTPPAPEPSPAVCLPSSPVAQPPLTEPAKPLSVPPAGHVAPASTAAREVEVSSTAIAPAIPERTPGAAPALPTAPFAEAAQRLASGTPGLSRTVPTAPSPVFEETPAPSPAVPTPAAQQPEAPAPLADSASDTPWWLSEAPRNAEPVRPPVLWQPARVSSSRQAQQPENWHTAPSAQQDSTAPSSAGQTAASDHAPAPIPTTAALESSADRTSRLSGLRNLLFVLGVKDPNHGPQPDQGREDNSGFDDNASLRPERAATASTKDAPGDPWNASPRRVTAAPEVLPPKPVVLQFDRDNSYTGDSPTRLDRRDSSDRVDILPSKRGQYRKT